MGNPCSQGFWWGPKQGDIPLAFLNNLQRVSYRLNPGVLAVANTLFDSFTSVGKMIRMERLDPPPAIPEDAGRVHGQGVQAQAPQS